MESLADQYKHINGWGIDADPENEPTYPMKRWTGDDHQRLNYERPELQPRTVEVLHSNERPNVTAVFGTSTPPSGLSGQIRRFAFRYSEGQAMHWFPLVLADRVNAIEGIIDDLKNGHVPNIFQERGWQAEWKYNRTNLIRNVLVGAVVAWAVLTLMPRRKKVRHA